MKHLFSHAIVVKEILMAQFWAENDKSAGIIARAIVKEVMKADAQKAKLASVSLTYKKEDFVLKRMK